MIQRIAQKPWRPYLDNDKLKRNQKSGNTACFAFKPYNRAVKKYWRKEDGPVTILRRTLPGVDKVLRGNRGSAHATADGLSVPSVSDNRLLDAIERLIKEVFEEMSKSKNDALQHLGTVKTVDIVRKVCSLEPDHPSPTKPRSKTERLVYRRMAMKGVLWIINAKHKSDWLDQEDEHITGGRMEHCLQQEGAIGLHFDVMVTERRRKAVGATHMEDYDAGHIQLDMLRQLMALDLKDAERIQLGYQKENDANWTVIKQ